MKTIILSAGRGSRLQGLVADRPKCLVEINGRTVLEWQVAALDAAGVSEIVVVTGYGAEKVEAAVAAMPARAGMRLVHNPFFALADNLASCWIARSQMVGDFSILNGDTIVEPEIARRVLGGEPAAPIAVTIDRKPSYDPDDMKVSLDGDRLLAVGKTLEPEVVNGESIGFHRFTTEGGRAFVQTIEAVMKAETGLKSWYLSAIDRIAREEGIVGTRSIEGLEWGELDFPEDLVRNRAVTAGWIERGLF
ncbi:NTP transferase domain-containing protein [Aureimonas leprariae]|uniref:Phosphocholine cytidylyltransferase family protein n=1 Tax=Plantimonas leprariae TaxID=2615207 RepID=A0A7V7PLK0_9HYPH|nr:phosphocholine cytidylyltransferase family protein [Aureimonas leprariae]KAB0677183.1 phosphocholine cytidylyltransferase family protein [Aureimonas leprariae]